MDNHKSELLETVELVSKFAGTLAGKAVVYSKDICDCAKNIMAAKPEAKQKPPTVVTESIKGHAEKKLAEIKKKEPAVKQDKVEEKIEKPKPPSNKAKKTSTKPKRVRQPKIE